MSETYATYKVWDGCRAPVNLEYNGRLMGQIVREFTIDRDALLKVADMLECDGECSECECGKGTFCEAPTIAAARIREACGVSDD